MLTIRKHGGGGQLFTNCFSSKRKWGERYLISTHFGDTYA